VRPLPDPKYYSYYYAGLAKSEAGTGDLNKGKIMSHSNTGQKAVGAAHGVSLILGSTLSVMALIVLTPAFPQLMVAFSAVPDAEIRVPALISVAGLGAAFFAPFAGFIGDRFGCRMPLIWFCVAFASFGVLPFILDDFTVILATRVAVGISCMGILVLSTALIGDCFSGESLNRWLGGQAVAATGSALLFLPLGGLLGMWLGWRGPFLTFLIGLPFAIAYWVLFRNLQQDNRHFEGQVGWSALLWRWLLGVCSISVLAGMFMFAVQLQIGLALAATGVTGAARIGILSGIAFTGIPIGALLFIKVASWPFGRLVRLEFLVLGVTLIAMRYAADYRVFLALAFVNLSAGGMALPTFVTEVTKNLERAVRARGIGLWQATFPAGQFLAVGISSLMMQRPGATILDAFWMFGVGAVIAAALGQLVAFGRGAAPKHVN
jgi:MFS family permease